MNYCTCEIMDLLYYAKATQVKQTKISVCIHKFCKNLGGDKKGKYTLTHHSILCFPCDSCWACKSISLAKKAKSGLEDYREQSQWSTWSSTVVTTLVRKSERNRMKEIGFVVKNLSTKKFQTRWLEFYQPFKKWIVSILHTVFMTLA